MMKAEPNVPRVYLIRLFTTVSLRKSRSWHWKECIRWDGEGKSSDGTYRAYSSSKERLMKDLQS